MLRWVLALLVAACLVTPAGSVSAQGLERELELAERAIALERYGEAVERLRPLVEDWNSDARVLLGRLHKQGLGVEQDDARAFELFRLAATDSAAGRFELALMTRDGRGVEADPARAVELLDEAAHFLCFEASRELARMLIEGDRVERDPARARALLRAAAERGDAPSQLEYGRALCAGIGGAPQVAEGARWIRLGSRLGSVVRVAMAELRRLAQADPDARRELAVALLRRPPLETSDEDEIRGLLLEAHERGDPEGTLHLGEFYLQGWRKGADRAEGERLLGEAVAAGLDEARFLLGRHLHARGRAEGDLDLRLRGIGLVLDACENSFEEAWPWRDALLEQRDADLSYVEGRRALDQDLPDAARDYLKLAHEGGNPRAFAALAEAEGRAGDLATAEDMLRQLAPRDAEASFLLARLLDEGGLWGQWRPNDPWGALQQYVEAGELGYPGAFLRAAEMSYRSEGITRSFERARQLYERAWRQVRGSEAQAEELKAWRERLIARATAEGELDRVAQVMLGLVLTVDHEQTGNAEFERLAIEHLERAATSEDGALVEGLADGARFLGVALATTQGPRRDGEAARNWLERAIRRGSPEARLQLGDLLVRGDSAIPMDVERGLKLWEQAALDGVLEAAQRLVERARASGDRDALVHWTAEAADLGDETALALVEGWIAARDPAALYWIGILKLRGQPEVHDRAHEDYDLLLSGADAIVDAAARGHAAARAYVEHGLDEAHPVVRLAFAGYCLDRLDAHHLASAQAILEAALEQYGAGALRLGLLYAAGLERDGMVIVPKDDANALYWMRFARNAGVRDERLWEVLVDWIERRAAAGYLLPRDVDPLELWWDKEKVACLSEADKLKVRATFLLKGSDAYEVADEFWAREYEGKPSRAEPRREFHPQEDAARLLSALYARSPELRWRAVAWLEDAENWTSTRAGAAELLRLRAALETRELDRVAAQQARRAQLPDWPLLIEDRPPALPPSPR